MPGDIEEQLLEVDDARDIGIGMLCTMYLGATIIFCCLIIAFIYIT